jgi:general stress protein 26
MSTTEPTTRLAELRGIVKELDVVMLATRTPDGRVRARPMAVQDPDELGGCDLWFITPIETGKVSDVERTHEVCVCARRPGAEGWISITATARTDTDRARIEALWKPAWAAWFPKGKSDPSIALLELTVEHAETWDHAGKVRVIYERTRKAAA